MLEKSMRSYAAELQALDRKYGTCPARKEALSQKGELPGQDRSLVQERLGEHLA